MNPVYYNEWDPFAAAWLRELIKAGLLPEGDVDERSIVDVRPDDLRAYRQCHFFAGIGGWPHALAIARWPLEREVWSASCPCQPLSVAGKRQGHADERHVWPAFYALVAERRPATVFGEQVASKDGREWLAGIRVDLEAAGYACGAANLPACSVGAPHRRERLYWVALADASGDGLSEHAQRHGEPQRSGERASRGRDAAGRGDGGMAHADESGRGRWSSNGNGDHDRTDTGWAQDQRNAAGSCFWDDAEWRVGADGKARRVKPGVRLLAHGVPNRVGRLRGYGNAIVPQVAAAFLMAATPVEAACHRYSIWHYPWPQRCSEALPFRSEPVRPLPPARPAEEIPIPALSPSECEGGIADDETRGRLLLRIAVNHAD